MTGKEDNIDTKEVSIRDIADGYVTLFIKANDTKENSETLLNFRRFCSVETNNNYTLGLRKLLEFYKSDYRFDLLYKELQNLKMIVMNMKEKDNVNDKKEASGDCF